MFKNTRTQKIILSAVTGIFFFVELFSFVLFASPAKAFPVGVVSDLPAQVQQIKSTIISTLTSVALGGLVKAMSSFMNKMARDTAMYIASGGKGQGAMIFQDGAADYFKKTALSASSGVIDDYAGALQKVTGIDTNQVSAVLVGLRNLNSDPTKALLNGDATKLAKFFSPVVFDMANLEKTNGKGGSSGVSTAFLDSVNDGGSMGAIGSMQNTVSKEVDVKTQGANAERSGDTGVKPVSSLISGVIKTPASTIQEENKALTAKSQSEMSAQQIAGIYGNATLKTIPTALMTFLNTLTSQLMKKVMSGDWFDEAKKITSSNSETASDSFYSQFIINNKNKSLSTFNFLFKVPVRSVNEYTTIVTELATCDDIRGINNCVIDESFMNILNEATNGTPMTIGEVLASSEYGDLMDKPFISPQRKSQNESKDCAQNGYCYYNMQKLRKLRIVPLGFEIAALLADPDNPSTWKLSNVVKGYYDCAYGAGGVAIRDSEHPFCHLIDPNWILKIPPVRCEAEVYGSNLSMEDGSSGVRNTECIDFSTLVSERVPSYYSYCTQEKNVWQVDANTCDSQYSTCRNYTGSDNKSVSYLSRTLDYGKCDDTNVGCLAYSTEYDIENNTWQDSNEFNVDKKILGRPGTIYFNDKVANYSCDKENEGCSQFILANSIVSTTLDKTIYTKSGDYKYFKKAPGYLGCYDLDTDTVEIEYPKTDVDLLSMENKPKECDNFSQVCIEDELGCKNYSPINDISNSPIVPGIVGNNICDKTCNGYETYRQLSTNFSPSEFPLYFISSEAEKCSVNDVGCDEFTNIDELNKGGESLQYYTSLRRCELPADDNQKTFYSWEGSSETGYVLKVHVLLPVDKDGADYISGLNFGTKDSEITSEFIEGSPAYFDDYKEALENSYDLCNDQVYQDIINGKNPVDSISYDCRALYNKNGDIYYRLLERTVTVSERCQPLRKTQSLVEIDEYTTSPDRCLLKGGVWEDNQCKRCYAGGSYEGGICYYWTIPSESKVCSSAAANGCRAYRGNNGSNIMEVFFSDFEKGEIGNWIGTNVSIESESLQVTGHSLGVKGDASWKFQNDTLQDEQWYQISFWARGNNQDLSIKFKIDGDELLGHIGDFTFDQINNSVSKVSVGSEWKNYKLGPVQLNGVKDDMTLDFISNGGLKYYIDNVVLTKLEDQTYLIKDSWKRVYDADGILRDVPYACDKNSDDAYPGAALGCKAYTDNTTPDLAENIIYTTGFDKLCREGAVGCTAMYDTYNNDFSGMEFYNAECQAYASQGYSIPSVCKVTVGGKEYSCDLINGEETCLINEAISLPDDFEFEKCSAFSDKLCIESLPLFFSGHVYSLSISDSSIIIPADTPEDSPIFLTYTKDSICEEDNLGCQKVALEEKVIENGNNDKFNFVTENYYKNNPAKYLGDSGILCSKETYGCDKFSNEDGGTEYFKDPKVFGNVLCTYLESTNNEQGNSGWFMNNVGRCGSETNGELCTSNSDCDNGISCDLNKKVPCYETYKDLNNNYGLWSNDSQKYNGFVGQCPTEQANCTELIDHQDKSQYYPDGQSYYVIFDDTLSDLQGECNGQVNLAKGCVLFDRTDKPTKLYNSIATYAKSAAYDPVKKVMYNDVLPITKATSDGSLDSNIILKVDRDRECAEWLYCQTAVDEIDENGKTYEVCPDYGVCDQMDENGNCIGPVNDFDNDNFTIDKYVGRGVQWENPDYTGYTLLNKKHVGTFILNDSNGGGEFVLSNINTSDDSVEAICKAFPEDTSPFDPRIVFKNFSDRKLIGNVDNPTQSPFVRYDVADTYTLYNNANVCQSEDCGCDYIKVQYQDGLLTDYWPIENNTNIPPGVCSGTGEGVGKPCDSNNDCNIESQTCAFVQKKDSFYGTKGFCLEYDKSRPLSANSESLSAYPCLTWLPFDVRVKNTDLYNSQLSTGYLPGLDTAAGNLGEVYCTEFTKGYLYSYENFEPAVIDNEFNITSPIIINNNYDLDNITKDDSQQSCNDNTKMNCNPKWFYTNLQNMMWKDLGSTATVLFSRIPYYIFKSYEDGVNGDPGDSHSSPWEGWWNIYKDQEIDGKTTDEQPIDGFENISFNNNDSVNIENNKFPNDTKYTNYSFYLSDQYPIILDDIRSLYLSPILFKKKENKANYNLYDADGGNISNDGYTLFKKLKIDVESLKNVYENRDKFADIVSSDNFNKYPAFSTKDSFVYVYNGYGVSDPNNPAVLYPVGKDYKGGGGIMHTYNFFGENKTDNSIRVGVVIDISDPYDYYNDSNKDRNTPCLVDEDLNQDGENKNSVYDVVKNAINTQKPQSSGWSNDGTKFKVGNFVANLVTDNKTKDEYREYAVVMFKFNKGYGDKYSLKGGYEPLKGGIFRDAGSGASYVEKFLSGLTMSVTADLKPKCTEFSAVHRDINSGGDNKQLNKAWTDRVWIGAQTKNQSYLWQKNNNKFNFYNFNKDGGDLYGILPSLDSDIIDNYSNGNLTTWDALVGYYFGDPTNDGYPLTCNDPLAAWEKMVSSATDPGALAMNLSMSETSIDISYCDSLLSILKGSEKPYENLVNAYKNLSFDSIIGSGEDIINQLFAKTFTIAGRGENNIYSYLKNIYIDRFFVDTTYGDGHYYEDSSGASNYTNKDNSEKLSKDNSLLPPQIYSLNLSRCTGGSGGCVADKQNDFTINNVGWNEQSGKKELIIANGSFAAKMKFFVFADTNKMPIKSIRINWDDGSKNYNDGVVGFYANRKPFCEVQKHCFNGDEDTQLTCSVDDDCRGISENSVCRDNDIGRMSFGDSTRACKNTYYSVAYNYICKTEKAMSWSQMHSSFSITKEEDDSLAAKGYTQNSTNKYCVYIPKIQVQDNWGWCNGTCDLTGGCYESECSNTNAKSWTTYPGKIIIIAR